MKQLLTLCILLFVLGTTSCQNQPDRLSKALELSGNNRAELEKVISHYSRLPEDALKLRAAVFLIENMPGHHSFSGERLTEYIHQMDLEYPDMPRTVQRVVYSLPFQNSDFLDNLTRVYDIEIISADFLIRHIEVMMECREKASWLKELSFDDFCEYVLPYRSANEPLIQVADSTQTTWKAVAEQMLYYDDLPQTLENAMSFQRNIAGNKDDIYLKGLKTPEGKVDFNCIDRSYYDINCLRSAGVASAVDFIPHWPTRNGQHYWRVIVDPERMYSNLSDTRDPKAAKVYRKTYAYNPIPQPRNAEEVVPELFLDPFNRDVSSQYMNVKPVTINPQIRKGHHPEYVYLCVFNNLEWHPIAWAKYQKGETVFRDMGLNIIYLPIYFNEKEEIQAGYPFHVDLQGRVTELIPNEDQWQSMSFTRKYPLTFSKTQWTRNLLGACFEGADRADFTPSDTVHTIWHPSQNLHYVTVPVDPTKSHRYWRISKSGRFLNLGELSFLGVDGKSLQGKVITDTFDKWAERAFDGDILTYNHSWSWIGMDFGRQVSLSSIRYISRTDGNGIFSGDLYELLYHGPDGWVSVEQSEAESDEITFKDIPSGGLYWLRNLCDGVEERIFTYENGRRIFW